MTLSKNPNTYQDIKQVLDLAVERGELKLRFPSYAKAVNFCQRGYQYIKLLREQMQKRTEAVPGFIPPTPYDHLILRRFKKDTAQALEVHIIPREVSTLQGVTDLDGNPIHFTPTPMEDEDELLKEAEDLHNLLEGRHIGLE